MSARRGPSRFRTFLRGFFLQSFWSFEGLQGLGLLYALDPWLRAARRDPEAYRAAALRHMQGFGTNPYLSSFVVGMIAREEERGATARISEQKRVLGCALAAMGDPFFWGVLRPACLVLALWAAGLLAGTLEARATILAAAAVYFSAFNIPSLWLRWRGLRLGYDAGEGLPARLKAWRWQERVSWVRRAALLGALLLAGAAVAASPGDRSLIIPSHFLLLAGCAALRAKGIPSLSIYGAAALAGALGGAP